MWRLLTRIVTLATCALLSRDRRHHNRRGRRFSLASVAARNGIIGVVSDTVLVVNKNGTVVERNETVAARLSDTTVGVSLTEAIPEITGPADPSDGDPVQIEREDEHRVRRYCVETVPLKLFGRLPVGRAVIVTDAHQKRPTESDHERLVATFETVQSPMVHVVDTTHGPVVEQTNEAFDETFGTIETGSAEQSPPGWITSTAVTDSTTRREMTVRTDSGEKRMFVVSTPVEHTDPPEWVAVCTKPTDRYRQVELLKQIQQNVTDVVWMSEIGDAPMGKQSMEFVTDSYADVWERPTESLYDDPTQFVDAIHPEDRDRVQDALADQAENPDEYEETYRIHTPDGETKWIHDRSSGVYVDGELQRVIGVATEITEQKHRERELERERKFFEQAINALSDVFYILDTDGTLRRWNEELATVCGMNDDELAGRDAAKLFASEDRHLITDAIQKVVTAGRQTVEAELLTDDDDSVSYEFTGSPLYDEDGSVAGVVGIGRDLTARNQREQTLRTFRQAVEHAGSMVYWLDERAIVEYVNPAFESQTGYDASALREEVKLPLASRAVSDDIETELIDTVRRGETWQAEYITRNAADERRRIRQTVTPVMNDESVVRFVGVAADVTDEAKRRQQLSVLHRILRHDLRNDLNELLLSVQLAKQDTESTVVRERLDSIERTVDDTLSLSRNVAQFRRLFEDSETKQQTTKLESLVREQVETIQMERSELQVELSTDLTEMPPVKSNSLSGRAVRNVFRNAVEHNDADNPQIMITATNRQDTGEVTLRVADNGPGIPEETIRVLQSTGETQLQHLDGVGLWLVKWVMSVSGGRIEFDRREPRGTVVTLVFQAASEGDNRAC